MINLFRVLRILLCSLGVIATCWPAFAHFNPGTKTRQFVATQTDSTTEIYVRTPIPLLFGDVLSGESWNEYGFLINLGTAEKPVLFLSPERVEAERAAFAARLAQALEWRIGGKPVSARVRSYRLLPVLPETPLTSVAAGKVSLSEPSFTGNISIGSGYVDMLISVDAVPSLLPLTVRAGLPPVPLSAGVQIDNHVVDDRGDTRLIYTRPGQLERAMALPRGWMGRVAEYVYQGFLHILEGTDHVFLVVAMALGAMGGWGLFRSVTAFTLGHAVTLFAGFLGYAPQGAWFIPAIEAAIAATIIVAAVSSLTGGRANALLYAGVGLLHGFGFSFVLANVLGRDAPELISALASFTVGIEIGQMLIVAVVLGVVTALRLFSKRLERYARMGVLIVLGGAATVMMVERVPVIFAG